MVSTLKSEEPKWIGCERYADKVTANPCPRWPRDWVEITCCVNTTNIVKCQPMANKEARTSIRLEQDDMDEIKQEMEENPALHGRNLSGAIRWLLKFAIRKLREGRTAEQQEQ